MTKNSRHRTDQPKLSQEELSELEPQKPWPTPNLDTKTITDTNMNNDERAHET